MRIWSLRLSRYRCHCGWIISLLENRWYWHLHCIWHLTFKIWGELCIEWNCSGKGILGKIYDTFQGIICHLFFHSKKCELRLKGELIDKRYALIPHEVVSPKGLLAKSCCASNGQPLVVSTDVQLDSGHRTWWWWPKLWTQEDIISANKGATFCLVT